MKLVSADGRQFDLLQAQVTIGRGPANQIVINDLRVSTNHATLTRDVSGSYTLVDIGSTNGTFVNNMRLASPHRLQVNEEISLGGYILTVQAGYPAAQPYAPQPAGNKTVLAPEPPPPFQIPTPQQYPPPAQYNYPNSSVGGYGVAPQPPIQQPYSPYPQPIPSYGGPSPVPFGSLGGFMFADNGPRFIAFIIDTAILAGVGIALSLLYYVFANLLAFVAKDAASDVSAALGIVLLVSTLIFWLLVAAVRPTYFTYFHGRTGQTPGKKLAGIKVIRTDGAKVSYGRAFWRDLSDIVGTIVLIVLSYFTCGLSLLFLMGVNTVPLFDSERRALHDFLADTRVVKV